MKQITIRAIHKDAEYVAEFWSADYLSALTYDKAIAEVEKVASSIRHLCLSVDRIQLRLDWLDDGRHCWADYPPSTTDHDGIKSCLSLVLRCHREGIFG